MNSDLSRLRVLHQPRPDERDSDNRHQHAQKYRPTTVENAIEQVSEEAGMTTTAQQRQHLVRQRTGTDQAERRRNSRPQSSRR